ncbi:hypothetical protein Tco_1309209 [Tanacetum coccineum]
MVLNVSSQGRLFYSDSTETKDFLKHLKYHPIDTTKIDASIIQNTILKSSDHCDGSAYPYWNATLVKERLRMWDHVLTTNMFVKSGRKGNLSIMKNGRLLPYARLLTTIFEYAKNELPNQGRCPQFKAIEPIFIDLNFNHLHRTDIEYTKPEHSASSSRGPQLDPRERMEAQVESWFDKDVWINVEDHM